MNSVESNRLSLKYQRFSQTGCKDIESKNLEFVAKLNFFLEKELIKNGNFQQQT